MKKLFLLIICICCGLVYAQQKEILYLKNGSVIKGEIIEQIPDQSLKFQTSDGSIFVYEMKDIERISKEESKLSNSNYNRLYSGWEFDVDLGFGFATQSGIGRKFISSVQVGKKVTENVFLGVGGGINLNSVDYKAIPVFANAKFYFPIENTNKDLYLDLRGGISFLPGHNSSRMWTGEVLMGMQVPLSQGADVNIGAGYVLNRQKGNYFNGDFVIKTGIGLRQVKMLRTPKERVKKPTKDKGLQLTLEGLAGGWASYESTYINYHSYIYGANVILTYKLNKNLSFGGGIGAEVQKGFDNVGYDYYNLNQWEHESFNFDYYNEEKHGSYKIFVTSNCRLNDKLVSPIFSLSFGMQKYLNLPNKVQATVLSYNSFYGYTTTTENFKLKNTLAWFASPELGLSFRVSSNSYLEIKGGYQVSTPMKVSIPKANYVRDVDDKINTSHFYLKLGFTQTF